MSSLKTIGKGTSQTYLVVTETGEDDGKDKKSPQLNQPKSMVGKLMVGRGIRGGKLKELRTKIAYLFNNTGAANTAFTTVIPVQPSASTSWSQFAAVYEEVIVHGGKVMFDTTVTGSGATPTGSQMLFAVAYNPLVSTAGTSVAALCEFSQSKLYCIDTNTQTSVTNGYGGCVPCTTNGLFSFEFKVPKGKTARSASASSTFSGEWSNTNDGSDVYGWITPYMASAGVNNSTTMYGVIVMDVSFRSRF